jgi:hypothetical protein
MKSIKSVLALLASLSRSTSEALRHTASEALRCGATASEASKG